MARNTRFLAIAALAIAASVVASVTAMRWRSSEQPELKELLYIGPASTRHHLFNGRREPGGKPVDPRDSGSAVMAADGMGKQRIYIKYKDGSSEEIRLQGDGERKASSQSYYPVQPGEHDRRPHVSRVYAADGERILAEDVRRVSGLRQQRMRGFDDGSQTVIDYADNGVTVVGEQLFVRRAPGGKALVLKKKERWRADPAHTLSYSSILGEDGVRTVTHYDEQRQALRVEKWPADGTFSGVKILAYWPGSLKLRLDSTSTYYASDVVLYREDGTISHKENITFSAIQIEYYDASGTKLLWQQAWYRDETVEDGRKKVSYRLWWVAQMDAQGKKVRYVTFAKNKIDHEECYGLTIGGVTYAEIDSYYDEAERLKTVQYFGKNTMDRRQNEQHTAEENIRPQPLSAEHMQLLPQDDDLPVPPQQTSMPY